jgi:hypothetical protein
MSAFGAKADIDSASGIAGRMRSIGNFFSCPGFFEQNLKSYSKKSLQQRPAFAKRPLPVTHRKIIKQKFTANSPSVFVGLSFRSRALFSS